MNNCMSLLYELRPQLMHVAKVPAHVD